MTLSEKHIKKGEALELIKQGLTQKEISKKINVSEQTLTEWLKDYKAEKTAKATRIKLFENHLTKLLECEIPDISKIERLTKTMLDYKKG